MLVFILFTILLNSASGADYLVCISYQPALNNGISPDKQIKAGDILLENCGVKFLDAESYIKAFYKSKPFKNLKRFPCTVLRNGQKLSVFYAANDYTDFSVMNDTPVFVEKKDFVSDLNELFYLLETVYIFNEKTNDFAYKQSKKRLLEELIGSDKIELGEVYLKLAGFLNHFNDGHLMIDCRELLAQLMKGWFFHGKGTFPFDLKIYQGRFYSQLPLGTQKKVVQVLSINDKPMKEIIESMRLKISGDNDNYKNSFITDNFPVFYSWIFGYTPEYRITFKEGLKTSEITTPAGFPPHSLIEPEFVGKWYFKENIGVLIINGFNDEKFFQKNLVNDFFERVKKQKSSNIIIDIRANRGGSSQALKYLMLYLEDRPYTIYDKYKYRKQSDKRDESDPKTWYTNEIEEKIYSSDMYTVSTGEIFKGHVYLLTSGHNYSTALDCIVALRIRGNTTVVGQPCGGNLLSSGNMINWTGKKSKVKVMLPVNFYYPYHYQEFLDKKYSLEPDLLIESLPFSENDHVLNKAFNLIKTRGKND